jgi:hypothetical protein
MVPTVSSTPHHAEGFGIGPPTERLGFSLRREGTTQCAATPPGLAAAVRLAVRSAPEPRHVSWHRRRPAHRKSPQSPGPPSSVSHVPSPRTVMRRCAVDCVGPIHGIDQVPIFCQRSDVLHARPERLPLVESPRRAVDEPAEAVARQVRPHGRLADRDHVVTVVAEGLSDRHAPQGVMSERERGRPVALTCPPPAVHRGRRSAARRVEPHGRRVGDPAITGRPADARRQLVAPAALVAKDEARLAAGQVGETVNTVDPPPCPWPVEDDVIAAGRYSR